MNLVSLPGIASPVSQICLGTGPLGHNPGEAESMVLLDRFVELGGNFIDTARIYSDWIPGEKSRSERVLGDWMHSRGNRGRLVIATKGAHPFLESPDVPRSSEAEIRSDVEGSLRSLRTDAIDLYWLHRDDPTRPAAHFIDLLNALVDEGKIRAFGASNWSAQRLREARDHAAATGRRNFAADQPHWCLGCQRARPSTIPGLVVYGPDLHRFHLETGMPVIPYSSQAGGFFTKLALAPDKRPADFENNPYHNAAGLAAGRVVQELSRELGVNPGAIVLAYLWSRTFPVVPIVGCRKLAHLEDSVAATSVRLTGAQVEALEQASQSGLS